MAATMSPDRPGPASRAARRPKSSSADDTSTSPGGTSPPTWSALLALQELTTALSAALSAEDVGAAIIARAMPALGANAGNVYLLSDDGHELVSIAASGYSPETLAGSRRLRLDSPTMMAEVVRVGVPILLGNWQERVGRYPHHREVHARGGDRAAAGLPLKVEGRTIGALSLAFPTDRAFD